MNLTKISFDLTKLEESKLTPNDIIYLLYLNFEIECYFNHNLENLERNSYIKILADGENNEIIIIREKGLSILKKIFNIVSDYDINTLVTSYRELFPVGIKTSGQPVKGDFQACLKKMKSFKSKYDYTDSEILEATRSYLVIKKKDGWKATTCAHYFIDKDGISLLAATCEDIKARGSKFNEKSQESTNAGTVKGV